MPKGGGDPVVIASGLVLPEFVIDATSIYWTSDSGGGTVTKASLDGGAPVEITDPDAWRFAIDGKNVYWAIPPARGTCGTGVVMKAPLTGGNPIVVAAGLGKVSALAVDATSIYWASAPDDFSGSTLTKMPLAGGPPVELASAEQYIFRIVVDSANVYWTTPHELRRVSINGGTSVLLDPDVYPLYLAVDGTNVFFSQRSLGRHRDDAHRRRDEDDTGDVSEPEWARSRRAVRLLAATPATEPSRGPPGADHKLAVGASITC